jgi:choice-of-anchor B domain-containing protein
MKILTAVLLGLSLLSPTEGNRKVMEFINLSRAKLARDGFFKRSTERDSILGQARSCIGGKVTVEGEDFPCENIDFLSFISLKDLEILEPAHDLGFGFGASSADIWGWLSPSGREITILSMDNGVAVIDGTDPVNPCIIAKMPTRRVVDKWADVKVYKDTLYHVKDTGVQDNDPDAPPGNAEYGIEVYDLKQLDQIDCSVPDYVPINLFPQFVSNVHGRSHNVAINPQSGLLYSTGAEKCAGGLVILDVKTDPMRPVQVGCADADGYTHDVQCLTYDGPDTRYTGSEICFAYNEDTLTIWNIDDPSNPVIVSRTLYPNQVYSHQGWVTDDLTRVLLDDELDEVCNEENVDFISLCAALETNELSGELNTTTNVFDIRDLENPIFEGAYVHPEKSIDHNLYIWGSLHRRGHGGNPPLDPPPIVHYAYMNNYLAGLKVVDIRADDVTEWFQAGYFDIAPDKDGNEFAGAWSGYMHPSGSYAISSIERGLFFLSPRMAFTDLAVTSDDPTPSPPPTNEPVVPPVVPPTTDTSEENEEADNSGLVALASILGVVLFFLLVSVGYRYSQTRNEPVATEGLARQLTATTRQSRAPPKSTANPMHVEGEA